VPQTSRNQDTDPSRLVNKYLDSVADDNMRHRPTSNLPFHPIVFSLGGMINGSTTKVFAAWKRVVTRGTYNLMLKRLSLCLLQARVRSVELYAFIPDRHAMQPQTPSVLPGGLPRHAPTQIRMQQNSAYYSAYSLHGNPSTPPDSGPPLRAPLRSPARPCLRSATMNPLPRMCIREPHNARTYPSPGG
jgi:hypothetical protein